MFVILVQSTVNTGKSFVVHRLKTLMRKKGFDIRGVDVANFRAAMRAMIDYFEVKDKKIIDISNKQSWQLSYDDLKQQARLFSKIIIANVQHRFSQNGLSVVFHGPNINLEDFAESDFKDKKLIKIFLDINEKEHKKRILSQIKQSEQKLDAFENVRKQHERFKEDAIKAGAHIITADKNAHKIIFDIIKK